MLIKPVPNWYVTSPFGYRFHPIDNEWKGHSGVDLRAPTGTPIVAANSGIIEDATNSVCGNGMKIKGDEWITGYCHLSMFAVSDGDYVEAGELIGYSGNTGNSTGAHLHFTVRKDGELLDPEQVLYYTPNQTPINEPTITNNYNIPIPIVYPKPNYKKMFLILSCLFVGGGLIFLWTRNNKKKNNQK